MKRLLTISFLALALFVGVSAHTPVAHADCVQGTLNCDPCPPGPGYAACTATAQASIQDAAAANININPAAGGTPDSYKGDASTDAQYNGIMIKIMQLFAWLVGIAMITLNYAVYYTVVTMGNYINNLSAVGVTWRVMQSIGNIMLIFGFLAAGIATIISVDMYGWGKKMLPMLLVAAIFLNFSLFLTEAVIDTGNLFATQFYAQINNNTMPTVDTLNNQGISMKIMNQLGLQTIYGQVSQNAGAQEIFKGGNPWVIGFMGVLLFIILAFVLFSLAFVLIARFIILLFLIIVAPVGFAGLVVPKLENTAKKWWGALFDQTITAPILLLLLYIALAVITDARFLTGFSSSQSADWLGTIRGNIAGFAPVFLSFLVAMGLLLAVVIFSKKMSAFGAGWATKTAGALTFGATAWAGRTSGGWLAKKSASGLRKIGVGHIPLVGTGLVRGMDRLASSSFDVRGIKTFGGLKAAGIEAGDAQKGGYKADLKARTESRTKYAADLKGRELRDDEKAELAYWQNEIKKLEKNRKDAKSIPEIQNINTKIKTIEKKEIERIERPTDKGAQRTYAKVLNLGMDENNFFNKYINFAANTDAAKEIRGKAKKAKPDKDWTTNMKNILREAAEEDTEAGGSTPQATAPAATPSPEPSAPTPGPAAAH